MPDTKQPRRPKLNLHCKSLFLRITKFVYEKPSSVEWLIRIPLVSREFLLAANQYKVYSLDLLGSDSKFYNIGVGYAVDKQRTVSCKSSQVDFEWIRWLSQWFHVHHIDVNIGRSILSTKLEDMLDGYRRVWNELYPHAKINMDCIRLFAVQSYIDVINEVQSRLCNLKCNQRRILLDALPLNLESCHLKSGIDINNLKEVLKKHKIRHLRFPLIEKFNILRHTRNFDRGVLIPANFLDEHFSNSTMKRIEIMIDIDEQMADRIGMIELLPRCLPNLQALCLDFQLHTPGFKAYEFEEFTQMVFNAIDRVHTLRQRFQVENMSFKLEIWTKLITKILSDKETLASWINTIFTHHELADAVVKPGHDYIALHSKYYTFNGASVCNEYYYHERECTRLAIQWDHPHFTGILYLVVDHFNKEES